MAQQAFELGLLPQPASGIQDEALLRCSYND